MTEQHEQISAPTAPAADLPAPVTGAPVNGVPHETTDGASDGQPPAPAASRHAQAGRRGARRVHELIREGRLYEQERGLKRGRQRLRQLIELGKRYEEEHGLRPARGRPSDRLSRAGRDEVMATLLRCLVRIAKPSFRADLLRLIEQASGEGGQAA